MLRGKRIDGIKHALGCIDIMYFHCTTIKRHLPVFAMFQFMKDVGLG